MSEEQLNAFLEKVKSDTELQEKLNGDADAVVAIAKEVGFAITAEDIQSTQSETVELSEEQLERANGGDLTGIVACYLNGSTEGRQVSPME